MIFIKKLNERKRAVYSFLSVYRKMIFLNSTKSTSDCNPLKTIVSGQYLRMKSVSIATRLSSSRIIITSSLAVRLMEIEIVIKKLQSPQFSRWCNVLWRELNPSLCSYCTKGANPVASTVLLHVELELFHFSFYFLFRFESFCNVFMERAG